MRNLIIASFPMYVVVKERTYIKLYSMFDASQHNACSYEAFVHINVCFIDEIMKIIRISAVRVSYKTVLVTEN